MTFRPFQAVVLLALLVGACSSAPSERDLSAALKSPDSIVGRFAVNADCAARILLSSGISDETLRAIEELDAEYSAPPADQGLLTEALARAGTTC